MSDVQPEEIKLAVAIANRILYDEDWKYGGDDVEHLAVALVASDERLAQCDTERCNLQGRVAELERTRDAIQADANRAIDIYRTNALAMRDTITDLHRELHEYEQAALERSEHE
jgi:hypothetical protein